MAGRAYSRRQLLAKNARSILFCRRKIEGQLQLVVVRRLPPMNFGVAGLAQRD
jgi:hypothetical protein